MDFRTKKAKMETGRTIRVAAAPIPAQSIFPSGQEDPDEDE
jgi:hypothetical protein